MGCCLCLWLVHGWTRLRRRNGDRVELRVVLRFDLSPWHLLQGGLQKVYYRYVHYY